jgi:hypothetical protein
MVTQFGPIERNKWFNQISSQESPRKTGLHSSLSAKSSRYPPAFVISCSCCTASGLLEAGTSDLAECVGEVNTTRINREMNVFQARQAGRGQIQSL